MFLLKILVVVIALSIFVEDILSHSVHWFLFPLLYIALSAVSGFLTNNWAILLQHSIWNGLFIALQLAVLTLYFSAKNKRFVNVTANLMGWGDILFWFSISCYFSPVNFLFYYIGSLILVLISWGMFSIISKVKDQQIPLAGLQAMVFVCLFIIAWFKPVLKLDSDEWIVNKMILK